jgi:hypothetical protein
VVGKKAEEAAGKSEVNQVPARVEEKVVEDRPTTLQELIPERQRAAAKRHIKKAAKVSA